MELTELIPSFGNGLYTIGAFIIALSIIVAVHEYGHYIVGRWCGIKAEVFSIGFGPVLWSRRDKHGTQWQLAALPFGGYVKFLGDAGVASDKASDDFEEMDPETQRHTMHGAPLWARVFTVAAGPVFNFILSIAVFAGMLMATGVASDPLTVGEVRPVPGLENSLRPGDEVLAIEGEDTPDVSGFRDFVDTLPVESTLAYTLRRDGAEMTTEGPYPYPALVSGLTAGSAAMEAGLEQGDVITAIDGQPITAFEELREAVGSSDGAEMTFTVWRDGETLDVTLAPRRMDLPLQDGGFETRWLIGITGGLVFEPETEMPGPGEALAYGVNQTVFIVKSSLSGLYHMAAGAISSCNLRGPIGIAQTSGAAASQGLDSFIWFIAVLSTAVGLLNLFPIPVLDGGHLVFHAYEAATGKPPSDRALRILMSVGLALLLTLMVFALSNDLFCP
ncbi:RIP metalloprotease RseP [Psychromarinibacter sp. C21-152]|uniref:Zinc metalloprotease n=1 Tax=Psychromarinibacter sediminicola TaxID=3033385 RepID=A0AAE3TAR0_9RHOB|nr:RIP metalloprotease RseP [Psychromarinibacter sediminicola]MDF0602259.1 RIP metalloprotease RseP [Psychromarinibacter sediminicola]